MTTKKKNQHPSRLKTLFTLAVGTLCLLALPSCDPRKKTHTIKNYPYDIITTTGMIKDIVQQVAGDRAKVTALMGEGTDPHLYKPTSDDIKALQKANIIFYNGLMLEGKMGDLLVRLANRGQPVYAVTEEIQKQADYVMKSDPEHDDPHVWMDVQAWMRAVDVATQALSDYDPTHRESYQKNAQNYKTELKKLDTYARDCIASIPKERRVLVTAHDAFKYMARAYDLEVRGIQGISTESEAGVRDIEELVGFLVERKIPAIFVESSVSDKNIKALAEGARAQGHKVNIGGELFSDAMGLPGSYEGTYIGMIDHNVTTITRALGGQAPKNGLKGKLAAH